MESYRGTIKDKLDAIYLVEAVRHNRIPEIKDRISKHERCRYIKPGNIFVWNEKNSNIKRWTDGKKWSASRVAGIFLTYYEMIPRKQQICNHPGCAMAPVHIKNDGLVKKCFKCRIGDETFHVVGYTDIKVPDSNEARPSMDVRFKDLSVDKNYILQIGSEGNSTMQTNNTPRTASLPLLKIPTLQESAERKGRDVSAEKVPAKPLQRRNSF